MSERSRSGRDPRRVPTERERDRFGRGTEPARDDGCGGATTVSMDKSLICTDDSSKKTDPYGELKIFAGSSSQQAGQGHLQPARHRAGPVRDHGLQRGQRLRPGAGERPRARRLHRPGHRLPGQRQLRGAALLDRRLQARQRHPGHGGHPLLLLRQGGQEGRAPGFDPRPGLRRLHRGGRGRPRADDGPAQPADPGVLQDPGRPPLRHARAGRLLPREEDPRPGRRLARRRLRQAGLPVRRDDERRRSSSATRPGAATTRRPRCSTSSARSRARTS